MDKFTPLFFPCISVLILGPSSLLYDEPIFFCVHCYVGQIMAFLYSIFFDACVYNIFCCLLCILGKSSGPLLFFIITHLFQFIRFQEICEILRWPSADLRIVTSLLLDTILVCSMSLIYGDWKFYVVLFVRIYCKSLKTIVWSFVYA